MSLCFICVCISLSAQQDKLYTFETVAELYQSLNKQIKVNHTPTPSQLDNVKHTNLSLNGKWFFCPDIEEPLKGIKKNHSPWSLIDVPSEWYMESFQVEPGKWAGYYKEFTLPSDWNNKRVIIRFGAVESECKLFLNGKFVGEHQGSMTQFEIELSSFLTPGKNKLVVYVRSESFTSETSKLSHYAKHQVGGLLRGVDLQALPQIHITSLYCDALMSDDLKTGELKLSAELSEADTSSTYEVVIKEKGVEGLNHSGKEVYRSKRNNVNLSDPIQIQSPQLWHAEQPFLYTIEISLLNKNKKEETIQKNIGFRKIEIRGNSLFVNNQQVKLRGVARHDMSAYDGRAIKDTALLRKDIEQLRNANCNFIRTSHYPPDEYLLDLCDKYGIFIEDEAPVCWDRTADTYNRTVAVFYCFKAMLQRDRNHPCVLLWSIGNESKWSPKFYSCMLLARELTPHIPVKFSHSEYQGIKKGPDIGAKHYPGWQGLQRYDNYFRPMLFGEALHINCYNTSENITDPALRDLWGDYIKYFVDNMQESPAVAGLGIWGAIDEMFYPKGNDPCGYGPWGIVDGFKREKPEFWHAKMAFSPIVVTSRHFQTAGKETFISIENRYNILNANQIDLVWQDQDQQGVIKAHVAPMEQGTIRIPHEMKGDTLLLTVRDRRGFDISAWKIPRKYTPHYLIPQLSKTKKVDVRISNSLYLIQSKKVDFLFCRKKGILLSANRADKTVLSGPLNMYLIPLLKENEVIDYIPQEPPGDSSVRFTSDPLTDWVMETEKIERTDSNVKITVRGKYGKLPVEFVYLIDGEDRLRIDYLINIKQTEFDIRQIGVGFNLPQTYQTLYWKRKALWSVYPDDHIGRPEGEAKAFYPETLNDYKRQRIMPLHTYAKEGNEFGSNDFRSTKHTIITASLLTDNKESVTVESNGRQHIRAWILPDCTSFLVANYSNGGNEHYLNYDSDRTKYSGGLKADGGDVAGWIQLNLK